jgi:hypothetical protein
MGYTNWLKKASLSLRGFSYDQSALLERSTQNFACQVDGALIAYWHQSQELFTEMQNVVNTQIANVAAIQK